MRGSVTRLMKLEAKRAPRADARFYVFGVDQDDVSERIAVEIVAGTIPRSEECRGVIWTGARPIPPPRWAHPDTLTDDELHDAIASLSMLCGRDPLPRECDSDALAAEIGAIRREIASETGTSGW